MKEPSREAFEKWAVGILGDNPNWCESGDCELAWQSWRASRETEQAQAVEPIGYVRHADKTFTGTQLWSLQTLRMMAVAEITAIENRPGLSLVTADMIESALALFRKNPERISISFTQRNLRIGYNQAARLIEHLEKCQYLETNKTFGWKLL